MWKLRLARGLSLARTGSRGPGRRLACRHAWTFEDKRRLPARQLGAALAACVMAAALVLEASGSLQPDDAVAGQLGRLFPDAAAFSAKGGEPPHFKAFDAKQAVVGYAFWTTELEPLERGYDGPIKMLVGMTPAGVLTGVIVVGHTEPYGDFSIDRPEFAAQFRGKSVRDAFRVGADIHAVSRATITVSSAARAVRNSARRVARALLQPPGG